ncbi:ubiquinol-cytochrome C chaperone family protein [Rhizorhabdus dicambivorans]|uniref:Ubiquinol-cytochrome C chaperone n=1 Tax=Rhizorhabdus dicambivorans TaxID=1850238 RepID=A0A2A4FRU2_9SPHN|nr:ubiquinol-cytochrome C chaperone family protein [Rhizorhabdus dicambivorans]ATE63796.1 ubiquinol-cytochrome C chaperone [Rhizorhabdus dicambivorans]PCE40440.1 ubiquinol-cytochrome C chaperone [Rhizorhabdus dicambivorans]
MQFLKTLFGFGPDPREELVPLYSAIVRVAREPVWYAGMGVPDTIDGRFDMVAAILSLALVRIEAEGDAGRAPGSYLTEVFIDDMEGQIRQIGIGDVIVGKHLGKMVAAMGGRLAAYRAAIGDPAALEEALLRNLWRGEPGPEAKPALVAERLRGIATQMSVVPFGELLGGRLA